MYTYIYTYIYIYILRKQPSTYSEQSPKEQQPKKNPELAKNGFHNTHTTIFILGNMYMS